MSTMALHNIPLLLALTAWSLVSEAGDVTAPNGTLKEDLGLLDGGPVTESGWSEWSSWSGCSRTCDGGAQVQYRRCLHYAGCRGDSVRYRICNMDPCPYDAEDFRTQQCSEYDGIPHEGQMYEWTAAEGEEPCALTCRAKGSGVVVTLNPRVHDGTRCRPGTLDMCINGVCQKVGCDLVLGSEKTVDLCGVCGGDGSSCAKPSYHWEEQPTGPCSATCGGGYQLEAAVCIERSTGLKVGDEFCVPSTRPIPGIRTCNDIRCPTSWQTGSWGDCSAACGSGYQLREVYCAEPRNASVVRVADHYCTEPRPKHRQPCNTHECPRWYDGLWSRCSVSCGKGKQTRVVLCRDSKGRSSQDCDPAHRPEDQRPCRTGVACPPSTLAHPRHQPFTPSWWSEEDDDIASREAAPLLPRPQALTADQQVPSEPTYMTGNWSLCSVTCGDGMRTRSVTCKIFLEFSRTVAILPDDQCPGRKPPETQRCVLPPCSHAMTRHEFEGEHVHDAAAEPPFSSLEDADEAAFFPRGPPEAEAFQKPQAQAYNNPLTHNGLHSLEANLETGGGRGGGGGGKDAEGKDKESVFVLDKDGVPPSQYESYEVEHSSSDNNIDPYDGSNNVDNIKIDIDGNMIDGNAGRFDLANFNSGGGFGEVGGAAGGKGIVEETYVWKNAGFTPCSASCLGGVQELNLHCVRKSDQKIVSPNKCKLEDRPDIITRTCNDQPCPPRWSVSEFEECSKPCGGGIQIREVKCIHEVTRGGTNTLVVPDMLCPQPPPRAQQFCRVLDCPPKWVKGPWSKCSAQCGGGMKERDVTCKQILALGQEAETSNSHCPRPKPASRRKCNRRACRGSSRSSFNSLDGRRLGLGRGVSRRLGGGSQMPVIKAVYNQNYVQSKFMKKLRLKVGGKATVFRGIMVKVKCPVRRFDRSKISWYLDGKKIRNEDSSSVKVNAKGVLKIQKVQYPDAGVYVCHAGSSQANLTLNVIALPSSYSSSEEKTSDFPGYNDVKHNHLATIEDFSSVGDTKDFGRSGSSRSKDTKKSGRKGPYRGRGQTTQTTIRPIQPFPSSRAPRVGGPFKASSRNMHTVEVTSGESSNSPFGGSTSDKITSEGNDYVYGTINRHSTSRPKSSGGISLLSEKFGRGGGGGGGGGGAFGRNFASSEGGEGGISSLAGFGRQDGEKIGSEERHVYGKVNRHSDTQKGEEPPSATKEPKVWPDLPVSTETFDPDKEEPTPNSKKESSSSVERGIKDLGTRLTWDDNVGLHDSRTGNEEDEHSRTPSSTHWHLPRGTSSTGHWSNHHPIWHPPATPLSDHPSHGEDISSSSSSTHAEWSPSAHDPSTSSSSSPSSSSSSSSSSNRELYRPYSDPSRSRTPFDTDFEDAFSPPPDHHLESHETFPEHSNPRQQQHYPEHKPLFPPGYADETRPHELVPPTLHPDHPLSRSGATRTMPYFQILLYNLEKTLGSRGGRHAGSSLVSSSPGAVGGSSGLSGTSWTGPAVGDLRLDSSSTSSTTESPLGTPEILGKGTRESLKFEWRMTNWSACSQTCGFSGTSGGYQLRAIQCIVKVNNVSRPVDRALCEDAGLKQPTTMQKCGLQDCPQWQMSEWSECESSKCFTLHYAFQRRKVTCVIHNGTAVSHSQCDERTKPRRRSECFNPQCVGVWKVGEWSECTAPCGGQGYKTRLLQCVWNGTKKVAGNACRDKQRPEVVRWCDGPPCPELNDDEEGGAQVAKCRDLSKYCRIVRRVNMCRVQYYKSQCCKSCS